MLDNIYRFVTDFIVPEVVMGNVFFLAWRSFSSPASIDQQE